MCSWVVHLNNTTHIQKNQSIIETAFETSCLVVFDDENQESKKINFESIFLAAIEEVFSSLGESIKQEFFNLLHKNYGITRQTIHQNIKIFVDALEAIFGKGAVFLEIELMLLLHTKVKDFKYYPKKDELCLRSYIEKLQNYLFTEEFGFVG